MDVKYAIDCERAHYIRSESLGVWDCHLGSTSHSRTEQFSWALYQHPRVFRRSRSKPSRQRIRLLRCASRLKRLSLVPQDPGVFRRSRPRSQKIQTQASEAWVWTCGDGIKGSRGIEGYNASSPTLLSFTKEEELYLASSFSSFYICLFVPKVKVSKKLS